MQEDDQTGQSNANLYRTGLAVHTLNTLPIGCYVLDSNSRFIYANAKAELLLSKKNAELMNSNIWELFPNLIPTPYFTAINDSLRHGKASQYNYTEPDNQHCTTITVTPVQKGCVVTVTETKEAMVVKSLLLEEQRRLKIAQKAAGMGHFEQYLDRDTLNCNTEFYRIHGLDEQSEPITPEKIISFVHPDDRANYRLQLKEGFIRKLPFEVTNRIITRDGEIRLIHRRVEFLEDEEGNINRIYGTVQDITRQASTDLILNSSNEICFEVDARFRVLYANHKAYEHWQMEPAKVIGKWLWNIFPEHLNTPFHHTLLDTLANNKPVVAEACCPISGKWLNIQVTVSPKGLIVLHRDITEIVEARKKEEAVTTLLKGAEIAGGTGSYEGDLQTLKFMFSDGMYRLLGFEPGAFEPTLDFIDEMSHTDDALAIRQIIEEASRRKESYQYTRRIYLPNGEMRYIASKGKVIEDKEGQPIKILGVAHDITEKILAEERLASAHSETLRSNSMLQSVFDTGLIGIALLQTVRSGENIIRDFRFQMANRKLEEDVGRTALCGKLMCAELPNVKNWGLFDLMQQVVETGESGQIEYHYSHYGVNKWFYCMFVKMDDGLVATHLDITGSKETAEKIRQLEARQQQEIFKATISTQEEERKRIAENLHNGIGQILFVVKMSLDQIKPTKTDFDEVSFHRAKQTTEQLLTDAIDESRRISHELTPTILEDFGLEAAINDLCQQFNQRISITCSFEGLTHSLDKYLEVSIYRMVQELVMNIVKHARATIASVRIEQTRQQIKLTVWDNGIGFNPQEVKGKGIGLATTNNKIKLLNGTLSIDSSHGTRLTITIPYTTAE